jgi:hypothetical protein
VASGRPSERKFVANLQILQVRCPTEGLLALWGATAHGSGGQYCHELAQCAEAQAAGLAHKM